VGLLLFQLGTIHWKETGREKLEATNWQKKNN
jgi:hypothetical protein